MSGHARFRGGALAAVSAAVALLGLGCASDAAAGPDAANVADGMGDVLGSTDGGAAAAADAVPVRDTVVLDVVVPDSVEDVGPLPACEPRDAGDIAWVRRAVSALLGRLPFGTREVEVLHRAVEAVGRPAVARALMASEEFEVRWVDALYDLLEVARAGERANLACHATEGIADDAGELAAFVRDHAPGEAPFEEAATILDLLRSSLRLDDLSPFLRANLFALVSRPVPFCDNTALLAMDLARRADLATRIHASYLGRDMECLPCHNSDFAVTDRPDPADDHHWPIAARLEQAVFGASGGRPELEAASVFRVQGVLARDALLDTTEAELWPEDPVPALTPWGLDEACGQFLPPGAVTADTAGVDAFLGASLGETGSIWDLETLLAEGMAQLRGVGLPDADAPPTPGQALAMMTASRVVDRVWFTVMGAALTLPHGFSRNVEQADRLEELTGALLAGGWSLRGLLEAIVVDPLFNLAPATEVCAGGSPYTLPPVLDPFSVGAIDPESRGNSPADTVFRPSGRALEVRAFSALEWSRPPAFGDEISETTKALGAYIDATRRARDGVSTQTLLTLERSLGQCRPRGPDAFAEDCEDPELCMQWEEPQDFLDRLEVRAALNFASLGDVVEALRDRLGMPAPIDADEAALIARFFGVASLDVAYDGVDRTSRTLRAFCGVLLLSPQFLLDGLVPGEAYPPPTLVGIGASTKLLCQRHLPTLQLVGLDASCTDEGLQVP